MSPITTIITTITIMAIGSGPIIIITTITTTIITIGIGTIGRQAEF